MITTKVTSLLFCDNGEEQDCTEELQSNEDKARQVGAAIQELLQSEPTLLPKIRKDLGLEHAVKFQVRYSITPTSLEATSLDGLKVSAILATDLIQAGNVRVIELIRTLFPRFIPQLPPPIPAPPQTTPPPATPQTTPPPATEVDPEPVVLESQGAAPPPQRPLLHYRPKPPKVRKQLKEKGAPQPPPPSFSVEAYRADKAKKARMDQAWNLFLKNGRRFQRPPIPYSPLLKAKASPSAAAQKGPSVETLFAPGRPFTGGDLHVHIPDLLKALTASNLPETLYRSFRGFFSFLASQPKHLFEVLEDAARTSAEVLGEELTSAVARVRELCPTRRDLEVALEAPSPHPDLAFIDTQLPKLQPNYSLPQIIQAWRIYTASPQAIQGEVMSPPTNAPKASKRPLLPPTIVDAPYRVLPPKPPLFPISIEDVSLPSKTPILEAPHPIETLPPQTIAAHKRLASMGSDVPMSIPRSLVMEPHAGTARELALVTPTKPAPAQESHLQDLFTKAAALPKGLLPPKIQEIIPHVGLESPPTPPFRLCDSASAPHLPVVMPPHAGAARELDLVTTTKATPVQEWHLHDLFTAAADLPKGLLPPDIQESIIRVASMDKDSFEQAIEQNASNHPLTALLQDELLEKIIKTLENRPISPLRVCDSASTPPLSVVMPPDAGAAREIETLPPQTIAAHKRLSSRRSDVSMSIPHSVIMEPHAGTARELALVTPTKPAPAQESHLQDLFTQAATLSEGLLRPKIQEIIPHVGLESPPTPPFRLCDSASAPHLPVVMPPHTGAARELDLVTTTKATPVQEWHLYDLFTAAADLPKGLLPPDIQESIIRVASMDKGSFEQAIEQNASNHPLTALLQDEMLEEIIKTLENRPISPLRVCDSASTPPPPVVMPPDAGAARELALVTTTKAMPGQEWHLQDPLTKAANLRKGLLHRDIQKSLIRVAVTDRACFEKALEQNNMLQKIRNALENCPTPPLRLCNSASTPPPPVVMPPHPGPAPKLAAWEYQQPTILGYSVQPLTPLQQLRNSPFVPTTPRAATTPPPPALQLPIMEPRGWRFDLRSVQWKPQGGSVPMMGGRVPPLRQTTATQAGKALIRLLRLAGRR